MTNLVLDRADGSSVVEEGDVLLPGKAHHVIDFKIGNAPGDEFFRGLQDLGFAETFIYNAAHAFRSGIRGNGGRLDFIGTQGFHKVGVQGVGPEAAERNLQSLVRGKVAQVGQAGQI